MNGEDMERRMHWLKLARELGQEDDFRALLDDVRREALDHIASEDERVLAALPAAPYVLDLGRRTGLRSGVLYSILAKLEQQGLVVSDWVGEEYPRRRRYRVAP